MVHRLDVNVGRIVEAVRKAGLENNTLIVFISDNGGPVLTNASVNAPFNGKKGTLLEGGIHVPYIMSWPGTLPKGEIYDKPVTSLDFAATFIAQAGGEVKEAYNLDGKNIIPYVQGEKTSAPHEELKWRFTISASIREGDWKLVRLPDRLPMLYHLPTDWSEQNNLALDNLEVTKRLMKKLGEWDVSLPHPLFLEGAVWKKNQLGQYDKTYPLTQPE
jgi:arylsulfatase A-like enzyme